MKTRTILGLCTAGVLAITLSTPVGALDHLSDAVDRYEHETEPVHKARALAKLGEEQLLLARKQLKAGDDDASLKTLIVYRDEVLQTTEELKNKGIDAGKTPAGFKELQISLRQAIRHIDDMILTLSMDKRAMFHDVRRDLSKIEEELVAALFPRQPSPNSNKTNP